MFNVIRLIHTTQRDRLLAAVREATAEIPLALAEPTLPGSRNGGDILVQIRFDDETLWKTVEPELDAVIDDASVTHVDGVTYRGSPVVSERTPGTVFRALLVRVWPETDGATVARFEDDLRLLTRYVSTITEWQLSPVESAVGASVWTHVFSQRFTDVDGLVGPYLMHPIHWAHVDRWFDPECPGYIVRDRVCHSFCAMPAPH
ncbi:Dabb family protein [Mycobacterium hodleri]|uniref:Dabb family protein n=1 Tax=Mycolicibacterium hodleri TaxID=49897 RepID=UPI0021F27F42|nr:Dabb family protein [Mycolicibacterium hodleri]MCV7136209.1 Dabb family protein [Mycolicibacterium hodleri]